MALVKCPECGRQNVSDTAEACPNCGFDIKEYYTQKREKEKSIKRAKAYERAKLEKSRIENEQKAALRQEKIDHIAPPVRSIIKSDKKWAIFFLFLGLAVLTLGLIASSPFSLAGALIILVDIFDFANYKTRDAEYNLSEEDPAAYKEMMIQRIDKEDARQMRLTQERAEREAAQEAERQRKLNEPVKCPQCGSTSIATVNRGYSLIWGFIGSGKPMNVCQKCGCKFEPGK